MSNKRRKKNLLGIALVLFSVLSVQILPLLMIMGLKSLVLMMTLAFFVSGLAGLMLLLEKVEDN